MFKVIKMIVIISLITPPNLLMAMHSEEQIECIAEKKQKIAVAKLIFDFWALKEIFQQFSPQESIPDEIRKIIGYLEFYATEFYFCFPSISDLRCANRKLGEGAFQIEKKNKVAFEISKNGFKFHCYYVY